MSYGHGTFEEIFVVRAVISAGTSLVSSGIYCQRAFIIKLKRTTVHVLMVTKELFIDFISAITLFCPILYALSSTRKVSLSIGSAASHQSLGFQIKISPQYLEDEAVAF